MQSKIVVFPMPFGPQIMFIERSKLRLSLGMPPIASTDKLCMYTVLPPGENAAKLARAQTQLR